MNRASVTVRAGRARFSRSLPDGAHAVGLAARWSVVRGSVRNSSSNLLEVTSIFIEGVGKRAGVCLVFFLRKSVASPRVGPSCVLAVRRYGFPTMGRAPRPRVLIVPSNPGTSAGSEIFGEIQLAFILDRPGPAESPPPSHWHSATCLFGQPTADAIPLKPEGETFVVPVLINNKITLAFEGRDASSNATVRDNGNFLRLSGARACPMIRRASMRHHLLRLRPSTRRRGTLAQTG